MKNRVVCRRDSPAQTRLPGIFRVKCSKVLGYFKEIFCKSHPLCSTYFFELHLLGLATVTEIGKNAPLLQRLNLLIDTSRCLTGYYLPLVPFGGGIGEDYD